MTKAEAIDMLVNATYSEEWQGNEKLTTAHLMAIEALKAQDRPIICPRCGRTFAESEGREINVDNTER